MRQLSSPPSGPDPKRLLNPPQHVATLAFSPLEIWVSKVLGQHDVEEFVTQVPAIPGWSTTSRPAFQHDSVIGLSSILINLVPCRNGAVPTFTCSTWATSRYTPRDEGTVNDWSEVVREASCSCLRLGTLHLPRSRLGLSTLHDRHVTVFSLSLASSVVESRQHGCLTVCKNVLSMVIG